MVAAGVLVGRIGRIVVPVAENQDQSFLITAQINQRVRILCKTLGIIIGERSRNGHREDRENRPDEYLEGI